jgi:cysteine desulfurase
MPKIYLDYSASTPVDPKVLRAMLPYFKKDCGNPSSIHGFGQKALLAVDQARENAAKFLDCDSNEIIFTGSATEANNLALFGLIKAGDHVITSQIEHPAILEPCRVLEKRGVEITYLPVDSEGLLRVFDVEKAIKFNTVLISVIYANNEIGTIQPIAEIGELLKTKNQKLKNKIYFHTDAVQAANYLDCHVKKLGVDLLTLSGHKIYGPKGVGALYLKKEIKLRPLLYGGGQEQGMRSGTENVVGIVGLGRALEEIQNPKSKIQNIKIRQLRDKLIKVILKSILDCRLNGSAVKRLPNNVNISFKGLEGEAMVIALDQKGIAVSTGSACSVRDLQPSHVLLALGLSEQGAHGSLRITLGKYTTQQEIEKFLRVLPSIVERLRKISGYKN